MDQRFWFDMDVTYNRWQERFGVDMSGDEEVHMVKVLVDGAVVVQPLPPIEAIRMPQTATKSGLVRWLWAMGYPVKDIYSHLGMKYQMVRNIVTTQPKRAAREDLPPMVAEYKPDIDDVQAIMDNALDESVLAERKDRKKAEKQVRYEGHQFRRRLDEQEAARAAGEVVEDDADRDYDAEETVEQ